VKAEGYAEDRQYVDKLLKVYNSVIQMAKCGGVLKGQGGLQLINRVNASPANFVKRLKQPDRKSITD